MNRIENYTVLDLETTGLSPKTEKIIEIGAIRVRGGKETEVMSCLVNPGKRIPEAVEALTGISNQMVESGRDMDLAVQELLDFIGDDLLVGQNIRFDYSFLAQWCINKKKSIHMQSLDTLRIARVLLPQEASKKLEDLCRWYEVPRIQAHRALDDARETAIIFEKMQDQLLVENDEGKASLLKPTILQYKAKRQTPATAFQIRNLKEYMGRFGIKDEIDWENLTRNEASRIQDRYFTRYGR